MTAPPNSKSAALHKGKNFNDKTKSKKQKYLQQKGDG
jgi:hypothetical protein